MRSFVSRVVAGAFVASIVSTGATAFAQGQLPPRQAYSVGDVVAEFSLPDAAGKTWKLSDAGTKPVILVFFSAAQTSYVKDVPTLTSKIYDNHKDDLAFAAITRDGLDKAKTFITAASFAPKVLLDAATPTAGSKTVHMSFGVTTFPYYVVLSPTEHKLVLSKPIQDVNAALAELIKVTEPFFPKKASAPGGR